MKKLISFILATILTLTCTLTASAATPSTIYKYTIKNGEVTITKIETVKDVLNIPAEIEGYPVTSIESEAFYKLFKMEGFQSINIPATVTNLNTPIIFDVTSTQAFNVDKNNPVYSSKDGVLFDKKGTTLLNYPNGKELKTYSVPEGVKTIAPYAFNYADVEVLHLAESVERIEKNAFNSHKYLKDLYIGENLKYISEGAFNMNPSLRKIDVSDSNKYFSDDMGVLFDKDKTTLMLYPCGRLSESYTLPKSTKEIAPDSFQFNCQVQKVVIRDGLEKIHSGAFKGCYNLSEIYISATVTEIGENAFDSLDKSFKIYGYKGSVAESIATLGKYEFIPLDHEYTADILGDITLDGKLNIRDATLLQKHLAGMTSLGETALKYADVDQNGKLNIRDATAIQKQISGLATVSHGGRFRL